MKRHGPALERGSWGPLWPVRPASRGCRCIPGDALKDEEFQHCLGPHCLIVVPFLLGLLLVLVVVLQGGRGGGKNLKRAILRDQVKLYARNGADK